MDTALNNEFNLAVDRLSQYVFTRSPNVDFVRVIREIGGINVSSATGVGIGGGIVGGIFVNGRGIGVIFVYGQGEGGRGGRCSRG